MKLTGRLIEVTWLDAYHGASAEDDPWYVWRSVGYELASPDGTIRIAQSQDEKGTASEVLAIPKAYVRRVQVLGGRRRR